MPIVNGKYVAPTWANDAPPAIDQTELQAISDTIEGMAPGGGSDGKRYARIVIGTSTNGWNPADCDYLCDGVDDQVEINQAIAAISSSGSQGVASIVILDGTYYLSAPISTLNGINLYGTGGTILKRNTINAGNTYNNLVHFGFATICNITFDGNESLFQGSPQNIFEIIVGPDAKLYNCKIENYVYGACCLRGGLVCWIKNNFIYTGNVGIYIADGQVPNIESNFIFSNVQIMSSGGDLTTCRIINNGPSISSTGSIILDGIYQSYISGNRASSIQINNTGGTFVGGTSNVIVNNILTPSSDGQVCITLGQNTSYNVVANNSLISAGGGGNTGVIQDNGTNNIINTSGQITLPSSGWSGNAQTVSATGVTTTNTVTTGPAPSSMNAAMQAGVYCSAQGQGTLTFTCSSVPSSSLTYNYTTQGVG